MITFNWDNFVLQSDFYCLMIDILTVRKGGSKVSLEQEPRGNQNRISDVAEF